MLKRYAGIILVVAAGTARQRNWYRGKPPAYVRQCQDRSDPAAELSFAANRYGDHAQLGTAVGVFPPFLDLGLVSEAIQFRTPTRCAARKISHGHRRLSRPIQWRQLPPGARIGPAASRPFGGHAHLRQRGGIYPCSQDSVRLCLLFWTARSRRLNSGWETLAVPMMTHGPCHRRLCRSVTDSPWRRSRRSILDVATGPGYGARRAAEKGAQAIGIDSRQIC